VIEKLLQKNLPDRYRWCLFPRGELAIQVVTQIRPARGKKLPAAAQVVGGLSEKEQIEHQGGS